MSFRPRHFRHTQHRPQSGDYGYADEFQESNGPVQPDHTGSESDYLKSLVDSRAKVTVVLTTGERLQGRIRYYDRYCFSIGLSAHGPRLFLRKSSVAYIAEEPA